MSAAEPSGIWAVVPVKSFAAAKQRLAGAFSPRQRHALVRAMMRDVLVALRATRGLDGIVVVTADPEAGLLAREHGAQLIFERDVLGLNTAVAEAAGRLAAQRVGGMLVVPGDVPMATPVEISALVSSHPPGVAVSLVPAHDGQGTNALLVSPPDVMAFSYGPLSCALHVATAEMLTIEPMVHDPAGFPGLALDIDLPADIERLGRLAPASHTRRLLEAEGLLGVASGARSTG
ncbi:2-phospho-L-lactate guanylyltransferase [Ancylobacter pratisalsi]|uniref:3-phospho-D-glycerate guanylyltransferase n=1 Tax=Ancylobacter pratisalsi TaxID=1745854 RepID=A0A6P1YQF4_9HYPH|nr:2-phospho-L-lactate guanylyltransferase [Ancylobacter pratisalsi]QIB35352.1 2-phospho-L-lactate guanylyltransferase [Ancylobacter pratisalsi]